MLKKIKVSEIFTYNIVKHGINLFKSMKSELFDLLTNVYDISSTTIVESPIYNLFNDYGDELDKDYFIEHSSEKYLSRYSQLIINESNVSMVIIVDNFKEDIINKFGYKWWKISQAITTNYKPLENYDMEEIRTPNLTENLTRKQNTDTNVNQSTESGIYGFNSTESQPTATGEGDTHTTGLKANNEIADTKTNTGTESLTRHGNIGVTTSQQMLESEIKLRQYNFIEEVFKDIDSILCLKVY